MKLLVEKLALTHDQSFVARTHTTPIFEVTWHQHVEYEMILIVQGSGLSFIGNFVGDFEAGNLFFLGSNLPHTFQKNSDVITSALIVQFKENFWGEEFLLLPEYRNIKAFLDSSNQGYKVSGRTLEVLTEKMKVLEISTGFRRIILLCECLDILSSSKNLTALSTHEIRPMNDKNKKRIDSVFQFTLDNFKEPIKLATVAKIVNMSVPAFCNYFKKTTRKKYIDFVNEIRVGFASRLLLETEKSISEVCYDSGFNTVANFNKFFLRLKRMTPSKFRKACISSSSEHDTSLGNRGIEEFAR